MTEHTKLDLNQLAHEIRTMNFRKQIYRVLKRELTKLDHWKDKKRGNPLKGYKIMRIKTKGDNNDTQSE